MSAAEAAAAIESRVQHRPDVHIVSQGDELVFELDDSRDAGALSEEEAAQELAAILRGGRLPRSGPCPPP